MEKTRLEAFSDGVIAVLITMQACLIRHQGHDSPLARAVTRDLKGKASLLMYVLGLLAAWLIAPWAGLALFVVVALVWLVPDPRIKKRIVE